MLQWELLQWELLSRRADQLRRDLCRYQIGHLALRGLFSRCTGYFPEGQAPCCNGKCCDKGQLCCSGQCVNAWNTSANCGACGRACTPLETCCGNTCSDLKTDANNCGGCNRNCTLGGCKDGTCCKGKSAQCASNNEYCSDACRFRPILGISLCD